MVSATELGHGANDTAPLPRPLDSSWGCASRIPFSGRVGKQVSLPGPSWTGWKGSGGHHTLTGPRIWIVVVLNVTLISDISVKDQANLTWVEERTVLSVLCCYKPSSCHTHKSQMSWLLDASHSGVSNHDKSGSRTMSYSFAFSFLSACWQPCCQRRVYN